MNEITKSQKKTISFFVLVIFSTVIVGFNNFGAC